MENQLNKTSKTKYIVLCTMVRQEAHVILRMLNSTLAIISAVSLTDTGSTDDTYQLAKQWCETNNLDYKFHQEPWINFGISRTKSLVNARKDFPTADYYLLLDADMVLEIKDDFDDAMLTHDEYLIEQFNAGNCYYNIRLLSGKPFRSIGATHEYWSCPITVTRKNLDTLKIKDLNDGGSRSDKRERDKRLLLEGLRNNITPDYLIGRYAFYLGQTYQGLLNYNLSNYWYKRCIKCRGWDQEVYYSTYQIAENYLRSKNYEKALIYFSRAWNYRPSRAEPLLGLTKCYRLFGMTNMAAIYLEKGRNMTKPNDVLFLDIGTYDGSKFNEEAKLLGKEIL